MKLSTVLVTGAWMCAGALQGNLVCAQANAPAKTISAATPVPSATEQAPSDIIQSAAQRTLIEMQSNRDAYRNDPSKLRRLVDKYVLPHFDAEYAARLTLGQYWRKTNPEQRKRFMNAFYHSLLKNYGNALFEFTPDQLKVFPTAVDPGADHATVRTQVTGHNADRIAMNYLMHKTPEGWKVYAVKVDGISYINSYRQDIKAKIKQFCFF